MSERQDAKEELRAQIWLPADTSRRLRAIATGPASGPNKSSPNSPTTPC
ncbi:hypothetical protein [Streptomyces sp. NPDC000877]